MTTPTVTEIVDFERRWPEATSQKIGEIRRRWGITQTRYFQLRNSAIATREALEHDPTTTHRIRARLDRASRLRHP
jgi:hypothetical protein